MSTWLHAGQSMGGGLKCSVNLRSSESGVSMH